jgi:2-polyprenyl-6-methoxyphenol hydroxylase-like FAD-dependent oxidoreductase
MKKMLDFIIVGAGPIGLYNALGLLQKGFKVVLLDKRDQENEHSRAVGIHPPVIDCFESLGLAGQLIDSALKVKKALVIIDGCSFAHVDFSLLKGKHKFLLMQAQNITESILRQAIENHFPESIKWAYDVKDIEQDASSVSINNDYRANYCLACDGSHSIIAKRLEMKRKECKYKDVFVMADFKQETIEPHDLAIINIHPQGLVESFPLDLQTRRWIIKTDHYYDRIDAAQFVVLLKQRTGHQLEPKQALMLSSFRTSSHILNHFRKGKVIFMGDAAHTMSPIGGQGMNLGFINSQAFLDCVDASGTVQDDRFKHYELKAKRRASKAIKRAEHNMATGRVYQSASWRKAVLYLMLKSPMKAYFRNAFAMTNL